MGIARIHAFLISYAESVWRMRSML